MKASNKELQFDVSVKPQNSSYWNIELTNLIENTIQWHNTNNELQDWNYMLKGNIKNLINLNINTYKIEGSFFSKRDGEKDGVNDNVR